MDRKISSFCYGLAKILCIFSLTSTPRSVSRSGATTKQYILLQTIILSSYVIFMITNINFSFEYFDHPFGKYTFFTITLKMLGVLLFYSVSLRQRREILITIEQSNILVTSENAWPVSKTLKTIQLVVVSLYLSGILFHWLVVGVGSITSELISTSSVHYFLPYLYQRTVSKFVGIILSQPVGFWTPFVMYIQVYKFLLEIVAKYCIYDELFKRSKILRRLQDSLPDVFGEDVSECAHYQNLLREFSKVKAFYLVTQNLFFSSFTFCLIHTITYFPITLLTFINYYFIKTAAILTSAVQFYFIFTPVFFNIGLSFWDNYYLTKAKHEITRSKNKSVKRHLNKFIFLLRDPHPDVCLSLFELDSGLLLSILDFVILIATSLFTK